MSRAWGWVLALWFALVPVAHAQAGAGSSMLGLPLVFQKDGWARYAIENEEGETQEVVFRVGTPGQHKGKAGRWIIMELRVPSVGQLGVQFLVKGERFEARNVLKVRVEFPGQPAQENDTPLAPPDVAMPVPKQVKQGTEQVAGKSLQVTEYSVADVVTAGWSPSVPALGLTRVAGPQPMRLVAFGVGGDPWKGMVHQPTFPKDAPKPKGP